MAGADALCDELGGPYRMPPTDAASHASGPDSPPDEGRRTAGI